MQEPSLRHEVQVGQAPRDSQIPSRHSRQPQQSALSRQSWPPILHSFPESLTSPVGSSDDVVSPATVVLLIGPMVEFVVPVISLEWPFVSP